MEADLILEGFLEAEKVHGVRYMNFVGDGDSSVYPTLVQNVPVWGQAIKKLECANHACKCYRGALERLVQENSSYKGSGGLTQKMRKRLVSAARSAIRMRSMQENKKEALKKLKHDLQNGPLHCFGFQTDTLITSADHLSFWGRSQTTPLSTTLIHEKCSSDFCKSAKEKIQQQTTISSLASSPATSTEVCSPTSSSSSADSFPSSPDRSLPENDDTGFLGKYCVIEIYSTLYYRMGIRV